MKRSKQKWSPGIDLTAYYLYSHVSTDCTSLSKSGVCAMGQNTLQHTPLHNTNNCVFRLYRDAVRRMNRKNRVDEEKNRACRSLSQNAQCASAKKLGGGSKSFALNNGAKSARSLNSRSKSGIPRSFTLKTLKTVDCIHPRYQPVNSPLRKSNSRSTLRLTKSAVKEKAAHIFSDAGPSCLRGPCQEGEMTCGKIEEVRREFRDLL